MTATLLYFHDPMCSWCWGYRPQWLQLQAGLPAEVQARYILGGLAPDNDELMPASMQQTIQSHWRRIEALLGTTFNFDFWDKCRPRRSTYPACRAVIAARLQGHEQTMISAVQQAYYLQARNPSDSSTLFELADECGLDTDRFQTDLVSDQVQATLAAEIHFTRSAQVSGFPSLALQQQDRLTLLPIDYEDHKLTLDYVHRQLTQTQRHFHRRFPGN